MIPDEKKLIGLGFQEFVTWQLYAFDDLVDGVEKFCETGESSWTKTRPDLLVHLFGGRRVLIDVKHDGKGEGACFVADRHLKGYRSYLPDADGLLIATGRTGGPSVHGVGHERFSPLTAIPTHSASGTPGFVYHYDYDPTLESALKEFAK